MTRVLAKGSEYAPDDRCNPPLKFGLPGAMVEIFSLVGTNLRWGADSTYTVRNEVRLRGAIGSVARLDTTNFGNQRFALLGTVPPCQIYVARRGRRVRISFGPSRLRDACRSYPMVHEVTSDPAEVR